MKPLRDEDDANFSRRDLSSIVTEESRLREILIVYEDRTRWANRAGAAGLSKKSAAEISYWLCDDYKIEHTYETLKAAAAPYKISVNLIELDDFLERIAEFIKMPRRLGLLIWNITDGSASFRGSHITALASLYSINYFGCPPYAQSIGQDKYKLYQYCRSLEIAVPPSALLEDRTVLASFIPADSQGPFFVKPNSFGNKVGLSSNSFCATYPEAVAHASKVGLELQTRMILQEYVGGPEVRLNYIDVSESAEEARFGFELVDSHGSRCFVDATRRNDAYDHFVDATKSEHLSQTIWNSATERMSAAVLKLSRHLLLKDYFTFDFRIDHRGVPWLIDFNPGAFLFGGDVEGYVMHAFDQPLPHALLQAIKNCHANRTDRFYRLTRHLFRL